MIFTPAAAPTPLRLKPPVLEDPTVIEVTDAVILAGPRDPSGRPEFQLGAGDWILKLPTDVPLTEKLQINGAARGIDLDDVARHIVVIGGSVQARTNYNPTTMRMLDDSDYALWTQLGFTGATGGTFRLRIGESGVNPFTDPIPWNASAATIAAALRAVPQVGTDGVFAVVGSGTGGPWKIIPGNNNKLGRPLLDLSGLTGSPIGTRSAFWFPILDSVWLKYWSGTVHLEGLDLGGAQAGDGIQVLNPIRSARLQIANVRSAANFAVFHNDWQHLDGAQMYNGPSQLFMENVELSSVMFNGFIHQPNDSSGPRPVDSLHDPWLRNVWIRSIVDDVTSPFIDQSGALYLSESYPAWPGMGLGLQLDMAGVYISRERLSDGSPITDDPIQRYYSRSNTDGSEEPGMILRAAPFMPIRPAPGLPYVSPGYQGTGIPEQTLKYARPYPFTLPSFINQEPSAVVTSPAVTIDGMVPGWVEAVSITGGSGYQKNGAGSFVNTTGSIVNGDTLTVRRTASATNGGAVSTTLTVARTPVFMSVRTRWDPGASPTPAGMVAAWYDPDDASTLTVVSGRVTAIADKSGNGRHLVLTSALGCTLTTLRGRTALVFTGAERYDTAAFEQPAYFFAVAAIAPDGLTGQQDILAADDGADAKHARYLFRLNEDAMGGHSTETSATYCRLGPLVDGQMDAAASWTRPSTALGTTDSMVGFVNGLQGQTSFATKPTPTRTVPLTLGTRDLGFPYVGAVGRILLLNLTGMSDDVSLPWRTLAWDRTSPWWVE